MGKFIRLVSLLSEFKVKGGFPPKFLLPDADYDWMIRTITPPSGKC